jgi:hypothetical protein
MNPSISKIQVDLNHLKLITIVGLSGLSNDHCRLPFSAQNGVRFLQDILGLNKCNISFILG